MAHVLVVVSGLVGGLFATFEFARRLELAGHKVTYASPYKMEGRIVPEGYDYIQLTRKRDGFAKTGTRLQKILNMQAFRQAEVDTLGANNFADEIAGIPLDLIIVDIELHAYTIAAAALDVPVAVYSTITSIEKRPGVPPLHLPIIPGSGFGGSHIGIELAWLRYRLRKWRNHRLDYVRKAGTDQISTLRAFAKQYHFPFERDAALYQWLIPYSYRTLPTIIMNALEWDIPHTPRSHYYYTGPMVYTRRAEPPVQLDDEDSQRLNDVLNIQGTRIYCAFGATYKDDDRAFWQQVIETFKAHPDWIGIAGLGGRLEVEALGTLPENLHVFRWVPQIRVLQHVDCAMIHGGPNSIVECLYYGVPMLMYPYNVVDQQGNAARAAYHGLGIVGDRKTDTPMEISARITQVLDNPALKARVQAMQTILRQYDDLNRPAEIVETLLTR